MNRIVARFALLLLVVLMLGTTACVSKYKLPVIDGKETVAMVNGEPITREEYQQEISSLHAQMKEKEDQDKTSTGEKADEKKPGKIDYAGLLQRMINARLIVQEAKRIGLNDLPEVKEAVENYSHKALRTLLMKQAVKDVKPDEKLVHTLYEKAIRDWKFGSIMFPKEDDAKQLSAKIKEGGNFDDLVAKAVAAKKARGGKADGYQNGNDVLTQVSDALLTMGTGSVSPVIAVPGGYALVKLEDTRLQESPEKKEWAVQEALRIGKLEVSREYIETLKKKLVTTDTKLLDSLDLGVSVQQFHKLLKDERVIAVIGGDEKIKVSDLAGAVQQTYYHGVEKAIGTKDLKTKKYEVLDRIVEKKVLMKEALNKGIDKTYDYAVLVDTYENSLIFGMFIQKVVLPDVKVMETEVKTYYEDHRSDYTSPEMMKLDSVVFKKRDDAEKTMRRLRAGDQLSWIKANAGGQIEKGAAGLLEMNGNVISTSELNEGLKAALSGASEGHFRLYEGPEGYFYVIAVMAVYPPKTEDYQSVREQIARQLFKEHTRAGLDDWIEKLKSAATVNVYLRY
jgi:parvulin-like peptidyl-prolyl isomerase